MQQNPALLFNHALLQQHQQELAHQFLQQQQQLQGSHGSSLPPGGFYNLANVNRNATTGLQKSPPIGSLTRLHHVTSGGGGTKAGHLTSPILSSFQNATSNAPSSRSSQSSGKIRAPISQIPPNSQGGQRTMPTLTSLGQAQNIPTLNQKSQYLHHNNQTPTAPSVPTAQRYSSQQVT